MNSNYIGMDKDAALALAKSKGQRVRIKTEDGEGQMGDCQYDLTRLNFVVVKGKVTSVSLG